MVMVALDHSIISDINGKQGGINWRRDHCGLHAQVNPGPKKPPTDRQSTFRYFFVKAQRSWIYMFYYGAPGDYESWIAWAKSHPVKNKKGQTVHLSAYTAFLSVNIQRLTDGLSISLQAPDTPPPPPLVNKPAMNVHSYIPLRIEIDLTFDKNMLTDPAHTPALTDFNILTGGFIKRKFDWGFEFPTKLEWINDRTLRLTGVGAWPMLHSGINYWYGKRRLTTTEGHYSRTFFLRYE